MFRVLILLLCIYSNSIYVDANRHRRPNGNQLEGGKPTPEIKPHPHPTKLNATDFVSNPKSPHYRALDLEYITCFPQNIRVQWPDNSFKQYKVALNSGANIIHPNPKKGPSKGRKPTTKQEPCIDDPSPSINEPGPRGNGPGPRGNGPGPRGNGPGPRGNGPGPRINEPSPRSNGPDSSMNEPSPRSNGPSPSMNDPSVEGEPLFMKDPSPNMGNYPSLIKHLDTKKQKDVKSTDRKTFTIPEKILRTLFSDKVCIKRASKNGPVRRAKILCDTRFGLEIKLSGFWFSAPSTSILIKPSGNKQRWCDTNIHVPDATDTSTGALFWDAIWYMREDAEEARDRSGNVLRRDMKYRS